MNCITDKSYVNRRSDSIDFRGLRDLSSLLCGHQIAPPKADREEREVGENGQAYKVGEAGERGKPHEGRESGGGGNPCEGRSLAF